MTIGDGDTLQRLSPLDNWIFDSSNNLVGVRNPRSNGADFRLSLSAAAEAEALAQLYGRTPVSIGPLKAVTFGASITNGSSSSNAGTLSYSPLLGTLASNRRIDRKVNFFGYPGQRPAYILSQITAPLAEKPDLLILGPDFGTNGAANAVADGVYNTYGQYVVAAAAAARAAGIRCVVCMTLPRGSGMTADDYTGIRLQNLWLATYERKLGIDVIDTHSPMLDQTTGYLSATYDGGDGVHPNDAGHLQLATTIAAWVDVNVSLMPWPVGIGVAGLCGNPLNVGATNNSWTLTVSPSTFAGTATHTIENRIDATDLPAGRWHKVNCDASVAGGTLRSGSNTFATVPGETLLVFGYAKVDGTGTCSVIMWNVTGSAIGGTIFTPTNGAAAAPFCIRYTVPTGVTSMRLALNMVTSVGQNLNGWMGAYDVVRPSALGTQAQ